MNAQTTYLQARAFMETVRTTNDVAEGGQAADGLLPASDEGRAETLMATSRS